MSELLAGAEVRFDPVISDLMPGTIYVGVGEPAGLTKNRALILTQKGTDALSLSQYVAQRSSEDIQIWRKALNLGKDNRPFAGIKIVVEDASLDSCLGLLEFAHRMRGESISEVWLDYAVRWELGDTSTTGPPNRSWGCLHNALVHAEIEGAPTSEEVAAALARGIAYVDGLICAGIDPAEIPDVLPQAAGDVACRLHAEAHAGLKQEYQIYEWRRDQSLKLHLSVPLSGSKRRRQVDALFLTEGPPDGVDEGHLGGASKAWARTDPKSSTGAGFAMLGYFRPYLAGTGDDMVISVDPASGLELHDLWEELERREDAAWATVGEKRPRSKPREIESFRTAKPGLHRSNEPWWDDHGRCTLIAAPRAIGSPTFLGTKLSWKDVLDAVWTCYAPTERIMVRWRGTNGPGKRFLTPDVSSQRMRLRPQSNVDLFIVDLERVGSAHHVSAPWTQPLEQASAAYIGTGHPSPYRLPAPSDYDFIREHDGVIVVSERGILLLDYSFGETFPATRLRKVAEEAAEQIATAREAKALLAEARFAAQEAVETGRAKAKRNALRAIFAIQSTAYGNLRDEMADDVDPLVTRVRVCCEARWRAGAQFERLLAEAKALEEIVLGASEARTATLLKNLSIYGLPAAIFGNILGVVFQPLTQDSNSPGIAWGISWTALGIYAGLSVLGAGILALLVRRNERDWIFLRRRRK